MKTSDVARMLGLSCSRVRQLTSEGQRPRPLPVAQWHGDRWAGWREYDRGQVEEWARDRQEWLSRGRAVEEMARRRARLEARYGGRLGVTPAVLDRWARKGWR